MSGSISLTCVLCVYLWGCIFGTMLGWGVLSAFVYCVYKHTKLHFLGVHVADSLNKATAKIMMFVNSLLFEILCRKFKKQTI